jgi:aconitate hydratase
VGSETIGIAGIAKGLQPGGAVRVSARRQDGGTLDFEVRVRLDTPIELEYLRHGGILPYVLRQLK